MISQNLVIVTFPSFLWWAEYRISTLWVTCLWPSCLWLLISFIVIKTFYQNRFQYIEILPQTWWHQYYTLALPNLFTWTCCWAAQHLVWLQSWSADNWNVWIDRRDVFRTWSWWDIYSKKSIDCYGSYIQYGAKCLTFAALERVYLEHNSTVYFFISNTPT